MRHDVNEPIADLPLPPVPAMRLGHTATWLLGDGRSFSDVRPFIASLAEHLQRDGVAVDRLNLVLAAMHPQVAAISATWKSDSDLVVVPRSWTGLATQEFKRSPMALFHQRTHLVIRRRIRGDDDVTADDFDILADLRQQGYSDYLALQLGGLLATRVNAFTIATKRPDGFTDDELHTLLSLQRLLAIVVEAHVDSRIATTLLCTYLGDDAGARVLAGQVQRGQGESIRAVVSFCDLRNFTSLSDRLPREAVLSVLDDTFDAVVAGVAAHGGEVLKFIGDAALAVFRARPGEEAAACALAHQACAAVFAGLADKNRDRGSDDRPLLDLGMSLHVGEVHYGNIGSPSRLDFTVIGPAVNLASRLQGLCRPLQQRVVVSADVAAHLSTSCDDLGLHPLKGIAAPVRVFSLAV
ncbi:MAG TPA: adenylate/guanylate cyclase domain-containing protein [Myxococcota bacterium]